ncbi:MAG: choice-of-anchor L domain-containing protein, partial [Gammaproteobacteria bacterium]|nr:choice-of-anchor L domain-containing protein [Gammaproteobacteria bacterium]
MTETLDGTTLANQVMDLSLGNVTVNSVTVVGADGQIATFTNGLSVPNFIDFEDGIVISSGQVSSIDGPNAGDGTGSDENPVPNADADPEFDSLTTAPQGTFDAAYIIINFTPTQDTIGGEFVFASEEYNEYAPPSGQFSAGNTYYDVMAFFVNGVNYSITADGSNVSINTVNETLNAGDYNNNDFSDFNPNPTPVDIEPDGFTNLLFWTAPVIPNQPNILKFGVADGGDASFNSWLLIKQFSFKVYPSPVDLDLTVAVTDNTAAVAAGDPMEYEITVTNLGPVVSGREITVTHTLPDGIEINGGTASAVVEGGANGTEWSCQSDASVPQNVICKSILPLGVTSGNNTSSFTFQTDAVDVSLVGNTLTGTSVVTNQDNDTGSGNDSNTDLTTVTASDVTGPTVSILNAPNIVSTTASYTVTIEFNEDVTGFDLADIGVTNGTASAFTTIDPQTFTVDITPTGAGDIILDIPASIATDIAGNDNAAAPTVTTSFTSTAVSLSILNVPSFVGNTTPYTVTLEFSEDILGLDLSDVIVANGAPSNLVTVDGNNYTVDITPDGTSDVTVTIPDNAVTDLSAVDTNLAESATTVFNQSIPSVDILNAPTGVNTTNPYTVTFSFSEDVSNFVAADVVLTNATAGTFTAVDGQTYTLDVTPDGAGNITIEVPEGVAEDIAANGNSVATPAVTIYDATPPAVDILAEPAIVNSTAPFVVTFQFDEAVSNFDLADISVGNGSASAFVVVDASTYEATITPDGSGDISIDVAAGAADDAVGNLSTAAPTATTVYDDIAPVLSISAISVDNRINAAEDDVDITVSGTSVGLEDGQQVTVGIDSIDYVTTSSGGSWSIVLPAAAAQALPVNSIVTADATDVAGNAATTATQALVHDLTPPVAPTVNVLLSNQVTPTITGTVTLSAGDVFTVTVDSVTYTEGLGDLTDNGDGTWTLVIPSALADNAYDVTAIVTDAAGNVSSEATSAELTVDTTAPADPTVPPNLRNADDSGTLNNDNITSDTSPRFNVPAGTATAGDAVTLYSDGVQIGTGVVAANGSFSVVTSGLAEGAQAITYALTDSAGNTSAVSPPLTFTLDTTIAAPVITTPIEGDDVINAAEESDVLITGTAEADSSVLVTVDDGSNPALTATVTADGSGNWTLLGSELDVSGLDQVSLSVDATATDAAGNSAAAVQVFVDHSSVAPVVPAVNVLVDNIQTPTLTGTATLDAGDELKVEINGVEYIAGLGDLTDNGDGTWSLVIPAGDELPEG